MINVLHIEKWVLDSGIEIGIDDTVELSYVDKINNRINMIVTKIYDLTEDEIKVQNDGKLFYLGKNKIINLIKQNELTKESKTVKENKLDICMISLCKRCYEYSKFNAIMVNEKEDAIEIEYICDCGNIQRDKVKIAYI